MQCPVCKVPLVEAGRTHKCGTCDGAWVREEVLVPLLEQSTSSLVELPWRPSGESHVRPCPECGQGMKTVALGTVALDHCEAHGVWFDAKELADLLRQAKHFRAPEQPHQSLIGRLARLF
jgi:Zn-finger nucleic acid-binding protein